MKKKPSSRGRRRTRGPVAIEPLVECVLAGSPDASSRPEVRELAQEALHYNAAGKRVVVLGGGTGLSTVVGGNSLLPDWPACPSVGLKEEFERLAVIVCTTDDGGSTGLLLQQLPMIGIGDLRKLCLSLILPSNLQRTYRLNTQEAHRLIRVIQRIVNHRFAEGEDGERIVRDPLRAVPSRWRACCPPALAAHLRLLGSYVSAGGRGPRIRPAGHSLGNILLAAAVFKAVRGRTREPAGIPDIRKALDGCGRWMGVTPGRLHPATSTPGQLEFRYANGVEVYGQKKAAVTRRGFPVDSLHADFAGAPKVSRAVLQALREADLIIYAPGSLYSSVLPVLKVEPIVRAIRGNRKALKILGANFWMQEGETDISPAGEDSDFLVSHLIEAYDRNVPGGLEGLFDVVLGANLEHIPGNILRNYALEGKRPIHFDRARVERMGLEPVEATLFSQEELRGPRVVHHDPAKFALAIRVLLYAWKRLEGVRARLVRRRALQAAAGRAKAAARPAPARRRHHAPLPCRYMEAVDRALRQKTFQPAVLRSVMRELAWDNRDILPAHLDFFRGARVVADSRWNRSREWDNVLGYYDPDDRCLRLHEQLLKKPDRLREDLLIALGESLLGGYIEARRWVEDPTQGYRRYEIWLRPESARNGYLNDRQLRTYLELARMVPDRADRRLYRLTVNNHEGFLPSGLLFGLMYAWYLNNAYGGIMEYEMSLLRWPAHALIPHQAKERVRKQKLVEFFRAEVFGHR